MITKRIDVLQRACRAWTTRDFSVFGELYTDDVEADGGALWLEQGVVVGIEAVVTQYEKIVSMFDETELYPEAVIDGGDTLVVPLLWRGRPAGSDRFTEQSIVGVFAFRGAQICHLRWFADLDQGVAAAGLPKSAGERLVPIDVAVSPPGEDGTG